MKYIYKDEFFYLESEELKLLIQLIIYILLLKVQMATTLRSESGLDSQVS